MGDQIDSRLLERFLAGDCTEEEREQVVRWVDGIPERQALLHAMRAAWTRIGTPRERYDAATAWRSFAPNLGLPGRATAPHRARLRLLRESTPYSGWRFAATIVAAAGLATAGISWYAGRHPSRDPNSVVASREVVTPRGQRATIHLTDGSVVTLAPASRLRESPTFNTNTREVWLEGEAYFEVAHDPTKPFRVHTDRAVAHDLGTKFLVRAYAGSADVRVVVADGLVSLRRATDSSTGPAAAGPDSVLLRPRELGQLGADGRLTTQSGVALDDYTAWTAGRLVFTDTPLRDAIPRLSRWYDADVRLGDPDLGRETFTATLTHEPVSDVVRLLAATVHARVEQRGDTLVLVRRRVPQ